MPVELRNVTTANLPDAARLCTAGQSLGDRPKGFTREVELESTRCKLSMLRARMAKGAKAVAAYREGLLVGYCEVHPVEDSVVPVDGKGFHVIHCLRVPEEIERDEVESDLCDAAMHAVGASGSLAVIGRGKDWGARGFTEVARDAAEVEGQVRVLWFRQSEGSAKVAAAASGSVAAASVGGSAPRVASAVAAPNASAPRLIKVERSLPRPRGKARLDLFTNDRCPWDKYVFDMVRAMASGMQQDMVIYETDCTKRRNVVQYGVTAAVAVNGQYQPWVRPNRLPDEHTIRRALDAAI